MSGKKALRPWNTRRTSLTGVTPRVLVVEDDPTIRTALVRGLTERGHAVASAPTGLAGLEHAVGHRPDVVVLDLGLPDVAGDRLTRSVGDVVEQAGDDHQRQRGEQRDAEHGGEPRPA